MAKEKTDKVATLHYEVSTLWESDFGSVILADGKGAFPFILARVSPTMDGGWEWVAGSESGTSYISRKNALYLAEQALLRMCEKWMKLLTVPQVSNE